MDINLLKAIGCKRVVIYFKEQRVIVETNYGGNVSKAKNIIFITSDEMRADCTGFMGSRECKTPNLDKFASESVVFGNHFAVHGKCVPSRISIVTGRYPHTDGFRTIHQHLPSGQPDLLALLKKNGYESAVFGHNHVWEDFWGDNTKSSSMVDYHCYTDEYFRPLQDKKIPVQQPTDRDRTPMDLPPGFDYKGRITEPRSGFTDDIRVEQAIHYLDNVRDRSKPFFLQLNFANPHPAYKVEEPYFSMYDRDSITAWPHDLPHNAALPHREMRRIRTGTDANDKVFREIQAVYYGMITKVDALVGKLIDHVRQNNYYHDTIVVFTTDHGDFAGQYGLIEKWDTAMNDCILRSPLIIHAPGLPQGARVQSLTEHTDIAPTLLELLGLEPDWGIHGESLMNFIDGRKNKPAVFADGGHEDALLERTKKIEVNPNKKKQLTYHAVPDSMARTKMVRTNKWKLVIRSRGGNELYDLEKDPWELNNLYGDPSLNSVVLDLQLKMIEWCLKTDTDRPYQMEIGA